MKVLFYVYHKQIMEGNVIETMRAQVQRIARIHVAGCPGRRELQISELDYANVFHALCLEGYKNYIGLEYFPSAIATEGLDSARELMIISWRSS